MRKLFGIIGYDDPGRSNAVPPATLQAAEEVGSLIACRGAILVSGGRGGVMEAFTTLLANSIVNRMKIMQRPSLADQDAMPSVRSGSGVFCHAVSGSERHQCAPD